MSGRINLIDLVENNRIRLERAEPMSKADRNEKLLATLTAQLDGNMLSKTRRRAAKIDRYIENTPAQDTDQLRLGERRPLKVQAANGSCLPRTRLIVLHEIAVESSRGKVRALKRLAKVASGIGNSRGPDQLDVWDCQGMYVQLHPFSIATRAKNDSVITGVG